MQTFQMGFGGHDWEKQNITTQGKNKMYDVFRCKRCGIIGKCYHLGYIKIKESDVKKMMKCKGESFKKTFNRRIKVTHCKAFGSAFGNITPGSIHEIVTPPAGETSERGEWVMGVGEPVLLLAGEYIYLED